MTAAGHRRVSGNPLSAARPTVSIMRLLHTSDWHLGRTFHGHSLLAEQQTVLDAVVDLAVAEGVDAVLVAGDLYDRAVPSPETVQTASRILARLGRAGIPVVVIAGNHDSAPRLGAFTEFLAAGGLHLRTRPADVALPVLLPSPDAPGVPPVAVYAIPYLEPELVRDEWSLSGRLHHQDVMAAAMDRIRADLADRPAGTRSVVLAHAFVVGAMPAGSERSIAVGGVESVTADVYAGVDYVALGHLHRPQAVSPTVRYPGSPLPYSFSEAGQVKQVLMVDLPTSGGEPVVTPRDLPAGRRLATVRGPLAEVLTRTDLADAWVAAELTDAVRPVEPMRRLQAVLPHTVNVQWTPQDAPTGLAAAPAPGTVGAPDDLAVLDAFLRDCRGTAPSASEAVLLDAAVQSGRVVETVR